MVTLVVISLAATDIISVSGLDCCASVDVAAGVGEVGDCAGSFRRMTLRFCTLCACLPSAVNWRKQQGHLKVAFKGEAKLMTSLTSILFKDTSSSALEIDCMFEIPLIATSRNYEHQSTYQQNPCTARERTENLQTRKAPFFVLRDCC